MKFSILNIGISFVLVNCDMGFEIETIAKTTTNPSNNVKCI